MLAGNATVSDAGTLGELPLRRKLHSHHLPCTEELDQVVIGALKTHHHCKSLTVPLNFHSERQGAGNAG